MTTHRPFGYNFEESATKEKGKKATSLPTIDSPKQGKLLRAKSERHSDKSEKVEKSEKVFIQKIEKLEREKSERERSEREKSRRSGKRDSKKIQIETVQPEAQKVSSGPLYNISVSYEIRENFFESLVFLEDFNELPLLSFQTDSEDTSKDFKLLVSSSNVTSDPGLSALSGSVSSLSSDLNSRSPDSLGSGSDMFLTPTSISPSKERSFDERKHSPQMVSLRNINASRSISKFISSAERFEMDNDEPEEEISSPKEKSEKIVIPKLKTETLFQGKFSPLFTSDISLRCSTVNLPQSFPQPEGSPTREVKGNVTFASPRKFIIDDDQIFEKKKIESNSRDSLISFRRSKLNKSVELIDKSKILKENSKENLAKTVPTTIISSLSAFTTKKSSLAKEIFALDKAFISNQIMDPIVVIGDVKSNSIIQRVDTKNLTVVERKLESQEESGFSLVAVQTENLSKNVNNFLFFYYENEIERERFQYLELPDAIREHWVFYESKKSLIYRRDSECIIPYSVITATVVEDKMIFLETSATSNSPNSVVEIPVTHFLSEKKAVNNKQILDRKKVKSFISGTWGEIPTLLPENQNVQDALIRIEDHKRSVMQNISIGVLYRKGGQYTREDIISNTGTPQGFYDFLYQCGYQDEEKAIWRHLSINWFLAPQLAEDGIRQKIGNSMLIIIFNDSKEPFNPGQLYLGQISSLICVVQEVHDLELCKYRISFYFCYESRVIMKDLTKVMQEIELFNSEPHIPSNYLFSGENVFDAITVKFSNCLEQIINNHPQFSSQYYTPIAFILEKVIKENLHSLAQKSNTLAMRKKRKEQKNTSS